MNLFEKEKSQAILLASYIKEKYLEFPKNKNKIQISPIKLQKTLYFLFAYWGQYIKKNQENTESVEVDYSSYDIYLFDDDIEAWTYGPVIPNVFHAERMKLIKDKAEEGYLEEDIVKKEFIDYLLPQLFDISDFGLVDLSHQDQCWKKYYDESEEKHNKVIPKDEIIDEYCNKTA